MKINMVEMSPTMLGASLVETESETDFTILLGSLLKENQIALKENSLKQSEEAKSPLEKLLEWMTEEVTLLKVSSDDEKTDDLDLDFIIMEQFPEWETSFSQIAGWLEENIDFQLSEDQQNTIVEMSKQIFQALHDLKPTDWSGFPQEPIFTLLKMEKSLQSLAKQFPVPAEEMGQLIELDDLSQTVKEKIEQLSKLEFFKEAIPKAFTKANEPTEQSPFLTRQGSHFTKNQINMANTVEQDLDSSLPQDLAGSQDRFVRMVTDQLNLQKPLEQQPAFRNFVRELGNIMGRSNFNQTAHTARLTIRLYPEELGSLRVELLQKDGIMTARFLASSSTAKEMLDVQMHSLRQAFSQQNIQVERIEVSYGDSSQLKYTNHQHGQNEQGRENRQAFQEDTKQADGESNFQETMNHILFEKEV
ncbi:flagellar hook-length control protein FliK [Bacillus sp. SD088]|uniref:flagellar hook-length control protein FliK n=1 Tax=Bacillus sp. SD088 TaxID=2782012 RepID=UPI001A97B340|nr:flagellar hook-length control protein FliK [Bacillus sp. SD088]MBO0995439.1 flagellar hook-length control protein FliK [Bacillus sp. SD088]